MEMKRNRLFLFLVTCFFLGLGMSLSACNCDDGGLQSGRPNLKTNQPSNRLVFNNVVVGKVTVGTFLLYVDGIKSVEIEKMELLKNSSGFFKIKTALTFPLVLEPGEGNGIKIEVEFLPTNSGLFNAEIQFLSPGAGNVDEENLFKVYLQNQNLQPIVTYFCKADKGDFNLDFGLVPRNTTKEMECEFQNTGNADLKVDSIEYVKIEGSPASEGEFVWKDFQPFVVPSKQSKKVTITYTPKDYPPPVDEGYLRMIGSGTVRELKVIGKVAVPLVELIPEKLLDHYKTECKDDSTCTSLDARLSCSSEGKCQQNQKNTAIIQFPLTSKGGTSKRVFIIRSNGDLPLTVSKIELSATTNSADFQIELTQVAFPLTLDPGQEQKITVVYTPTQDAKVGEDDLEKGRVIVSSDAANNPKAPIVLKAATRGCNLEVSIKDRKLVFRSSISSPVSVYNQGNENCFVKKIYLKSNATDPFSLIPIPSPDQTVVPNAQLDFKVKFTPKAKQEVNDILVIESSDPDEPIIEVLLEGKISDVRECQIEATPSTLTFGLVPLGRSLKQNVVVKNTGWGDCTINGVSVVGTKPSSGHTAFLLSTSVQTPMTLSSNGTLRLDINFTPPSSTGYEGQLKIESNDSDKPTYNIQLNGSSGNLCLEIVPSTMDFGSTKFGCATPNRDIEVYNLGASGCSASIKIKSIKLGASSSAEFKLKVAPPVPLTITSGNSFKITMAYKALDLGSDRGVLEIGNDIQGQDPITVPLIGEGVDSDDQTDVFGQKSQPAADILFVVDDSCSMSEEQTSLSQNFNAFINWAVRLNVDYHIGVTTTDVSGSKFKAGCLQGSTKIVTNSTPNGEKVFELNVKVGISGSGTEKGLEASYKALTPPTSTDATCNKGFYREDASLSIVYVSDEADQSPNTTQFYISFLKNLKGFRNSDLVRASAIVGPPPSGCVSSAVGTANSAPKYWEVAKQMNGVQESLCAKDWAATLSNIGNITFGYRTQFFLSRQAKQSTLQVKVNGAIVKEDPTDGWSYDSVNNSINFSKSQVPPPGATIEAKYTAICLP